MTKKELEGYVAAILNERELVINIGSNQGVAVGMKFKILANSPTSIYDPISKERIGELNLEKVKVKCTKVEEQFSVCTTYVVHRYSGIFTATSQFQKMFEDREVVETLRIDPAYKPAPLAEEDSYVKIGDRCVEIFEE
jgi:hypothetical protein